MVDELSRTFAALSDPTRRAMLERLSRGEANVSELAEPFLCEISLPAVTKHLKVLEKAGLVVKTRSAQWRPCRLNGAPLAEAADWMEHYRQFWEASFDRLGEYLRRVQAPGDRPGQAGTKKTRRPKPGGKKNARKTE